MPAQGALASRGMRSPRPLRVALLLAVVGLAGAVGVSYGRALLAPGTDTVAQRTVEWLRDQGAGPLVDLAEQAWYAANEPEAGGEPDPSELTAMVAQAPSATPVFGPNDHRHRPPDPLVTPAAQPFPGEGQWTPFGPLVSGLPSGYQTSIRPDEKHTSAVVRVLWLDPDALRFMQYEGDKLEKPWVRGNHVTTTQQQNLVAAFSTGFRLSGSRGGFYLLGREVRKLRRDAASLVVDQQGRIAVGQVPRDYTLSELESVRQNLDLIVDDGKVWDKLIEQPNEQWGYTGPHNVTATWRSGAGVRADGTFLYVVGPALSIRTLADTLVRAGAVRGMQLEINREWISFNTYAPGPDGVVYGTKLDPKLEHPGDRYLTDDTREFMAAFVRPANLEDPPLAAAVN